MVKYKWNLFNLINSKKSYLNSWIGCKNKKYENIIIKIKINTKVKK